MQKNISIQSIVISLLISISLSITGCNDSSYTNMDNIIETNNISVLKLSQSNPSNLDESDLVKIINIKEPIVIDLCYTHDAVNHHASIQDVEGNILIEMYAQDSSFNCATDEADPVELKAGTYFFMLIMMMSQILLHT